METVNHETYVSLEVAKLLRQLGFDWEVISFYTNDITEGCESEYELRLVKFDNWNGKNKTWCDLISAPTLEVAQRWLREVKNCYTGVEVFVHDLDKNNIYYTYNWVVYFNGDRYSGSDYDTTRYYEVAQEASIKKALKIILEKK